MTRWQQAVVVICAAIFALSIVLSIRTAVVANKDTQRLGGVREAGPCRHAVQVRGYPAGLTNPECRRQAFLIAAACLSDRRPLDVQKRRGCRALIQGKGVRLKGVVTRSGSNPSGQPGPGSPGPQGPPGPPGPASPLDPITKPLAPILKQVPKVP